MGILDYNIWEVIGLELSENEKSEFESGFAESAWYKFLAEDLETLLTADEYNGLLEKFQNKDSSKEQFILAIKQKLQSKAIDFDLKMQEALESVLKTFVGDQIDFIEKNASASNDQTEKSLKLAFVKNLRELQTQEAWDKMSEIFKKINGYSTAGSLVTHL